MGLPAEAALLRALHGTDSLASAASSWMVNFIPEGTVVHHKPTDRYLLSLGTVGLVANLTWPLDREVMKNGVIYLTLTVKGEVPVPRD
eukprot:1273103-Lingulodinium_polyedra.AAC.1